MAECECGTKKVYDAAEDELYCPACRQSFNEGRAYWRPIWEAERGEREALQQARDDGDTSPGHIYNILKGRV